jgi:hypothetical protein
MGKSIQIRISKEEIDAAVKKYINGRIEQVCKKQGVDEQIALEINQAVIEVRVIDYEERIKKLEEKVWGG